MTHVRKPNRRPLVVLSSAGAGGDDLCPIAGKLRYLDERSARLALTQLGSRNAEPDRVLATYRCPSCGDWHVGHRPA
jgi:hypothetical protein